MAPFFPTHTHTYIHAHAGEWAAQKLPADVLDCGDPISSCVPLSKKRELFYISLGGKKGKILTAIELTQVLRGLPHIILDWVRFYEFESHSLSDMVGKMG